MVFLLALIPWVLTTIALLYIMVRNNNNNNNDNDNHDDYFDDDYYDEKETVRVAVYDEKAYWVYENVFYQAEVTREPDFSTAEPIDTMSLNQKELKELMAILDELQQHNERD
jgi:hypothetical protein